MRNVILAAAALAAAGIVSAHAGTLAGTYDGHCDGFSLTLASNGAAYGSETGCENGAIAGAKGKYKGAVVNEPHVANTVYLIDAVSHTWAIYETNGAILQNGTWTPVAAGRAPPKNNLPPTGQR